MNSRSIVASLLRKYHKEKWILNREEIMKIHDALRTKHKKFQTRSVEQGLGQTKNKILFALQSGVFFHKKGFLLIGDAMDELYVEYEMKSSFKDIFIKAEGHTLFYMQGDRVKKMTLSVREMTFFFKYIDECEEWFQPWDWSEFALESA